MIAVVLEHARKHRTYGVFARGFRHMKKLIVQLIVLMLMLLIACAPVAPPAKEMKAPGAADTSVVTKEEVVQPPQPKPVVRPEEVTGTPIEPTGRKIDPYSQIGCEQLLSAPEFEKACGKETDSFIVTYKIGTKNCYVNARGKQNDRLTAGVSLTGFKDAVAAMTEFERRAHVLKVGADKSVGEKAYTNPAPLVDRETVNFVRGEYIVEVGSDTRLCEKAGVTDVAHIVDSHLK